MTDGTPPAISKKSTDKGKKQKPPAGKGYMYRPVWPVMRIPKDSYKYWDQLTVEMKSCTDFESLYALCLQVAPNLPPLVTCNLTNVRLSSDRFDTTAKKWIPPSCKIKDPFPIETKGDGKCLLYAISRLVFGDSMHCRELRCRAVIEGCLNSEKYWDNEYLRSGTQLESGADPSVIYKITSGHMDYAGESNETVFTRELFIWRLENTDSSLWHIHMLASVLGRAIYSLYYPLASTRAGFNQQSLVFNKLCRPWQRCDWYKSPAIAVLWTHTGRAKIPGKDSPNHFVAVVNAEPVYIKKVDESGVTTPRAMTMISLEGEKDVETSSEEPELVDAEHYP